MKVIDIGFDIEVSQKEVAACLKLADLLGRVALSLDDKRCLFPAAGSCDKQTTQGKQTMKRHSDNS
ncbi:MAG: hypothetical protein HRU11_11355 [Parvularculaceae bacterium]|nr:hypothetical protein [Parvularculaceae bacterium]